MIIKAYVRRIPLRDWSVQDKDGFASILLHGWQIWWGVLFSWHLSLMHSMTYPQRIGQTMMSNGLYPVWVYKGHLWLANSSANVDDIIKKGERTKPRYNAQEQWWWEFTDPSIKGLFESMDRYMLGLKQNHDAVWSTFSKPKKKKTRDRADSIGVRDNRYIPQWVKIHVVLRDRGRCVYCGESNLKILEFDHRKAWSKGGSSKDPLNICLGCKPCNRKKSDKDWGWN
tara:strand:- start:1786 stop:2466 length:681 start_codon:yes stop_codon:yes gene_type:complete